MEAEQRIPRRRTTRGHSHRERERGRNCKKQRWDRGECEIECME